MKPPSDQALARLMLETLETGYSFGLFYRRNGRRYALLVFAGLFTITLLVSLRMWPVGVLVGGMIVGALIRDLGWVRSTRRTWPFTQRVIDWDKVRVLAAEAADQTAER